MKLKTIFTVNYILALLFGIGFTFFPMLCISLMGFDVAGDASLVASGMGVFVIGTGVLAFFARNTSESEARQAIVLSLFTLYILLILYKLTLNLVYGFSFNTMFALIYITNISHFKYWRKVIVFIGITNYMINKNDFFYFLKFSVIQCGIQQRLP